MPKTHKSIRLDRNTVAQIEALAFKEERTFSAMADKLLREGIEARSMGEASKNVEAATR